MNVSITSSETREYNCIAWAAGCDDQWWWPEDFSYWPDEVIREETVNAFIALYAALGYEKCDDNDQEPKYEKVAIYAKDGKPTHAARQLSNGRWTSKLGGGHDVEHELGALERGIYGFVTAYMRRARSAEMPK